MISRAVTKDALLRGLGIEHPIIQGPMGGGPSTPELVAAVSNAGTPKYKLIAEDTAGHAHPQPDPRDALD